MMSEEQKLLSGKGRALQVTEKGRGYQTAQKTKLYKQLLKRLRSRGALLLDSIAQDEKPEVIRKDFDIWRHDYVEFVQTHDVLCALTDEEERKVMQDEHAKNLIEVNELKSKMEAQLPAVSMEGATRAKSETAGSRCSRASGSDNEVKTQIVLMKLKMQQDRAELEARAAMSRKRLLLKQKQEQLLLEQEQLEIETEISINEAKLKVVNKYDTDGQDRASVNPGVQKTETDAENLESKGVNDARAALNDVTCDDAAHVETVNAGGQAEGEVRQTEAALHRLADVLAEQQTINRLPTLEPGVFRGKVEEFPMWLKSFETYIEHRTSSPIERLHFLGKYTAGDAKTAILSLLHLRTDTAYQQAKAKLNDRFGNDFIVSNAYRMKIRNWPAIRSEDGRALRDFADFLEHCQAAAAGSLQHLGILDDYLEIQMMVKKLPKHLVDRWKREVDKKLYNGEGDTTGRYPNFAEFVRFIRVEARIACGPVDALTTDEKKETQHKTTQNRAKTFLSSTEVKKVDTGPQVGTRKSPTCELCQHQHGIKECEMFKRMTPCERNNKVNQLGLCRGCLRRGHRWKECRSRCKCDECGRLHPTVLHDESLLRKVETQADDKLKKPADRAPQATSFRSGSVADAEEESCSHSLVLPVLLSHDGNPEHQILVYAVLDAQSDACFVSESVCENLNVDGRVTKLELSTMTGKSIIHSRAVDDLVIQPLTGEEAIKLPSVYSRPEIPCSKKSIPRRETALKWKHLKGMAAKMPEFFQDSPVALLLGTSCSRAIKPLEVVCGEDDEPWAVRTHLGWGIVGCLNGGNEEEGMCHLVGTGDGRQKRCHFAFRSQVREVSPLEVLQVLESDFHETRRENKTGLSIQDQQFVKKMSEGLRRRDDGHFEMPLPLKNDRMSLPNNKTVAMQRLKGLKTKLVRNESYRRDYTGFMAATLAKGYAEEVPSEELSLNNGRVWYIPHHGVYHPQKKDKIRVVFDCSAEFRGNVLNSQLLQGPDLTNSLTGILCRFRKQPVAISCDLEAMFHQVGVTAQDRNLLRFLWWKDCDLEKDPREYRMKTHLFGATSSPACAMFALRAAADCHRDDAEKEAADFMKEDFYIDDGLTSVQDVQTAVSLIDMTRQLCARAGFKVHKIVSNSVEVVKSVPVESRCAGLQSLDVGSSNLPVERTLGVEWDTDTDTFSIHVRPRTKEVNRRGILSVVSSVFDPLGLVSPFVLKGKLLLRELCRGGFGWDEPIPSDVVEAWRNWTASTLALKNVRVPRCYVEGGLRDEMIVELHHFSDASSIGYGQCSYLRTVGSDGLVSCSLVISKSRVVPTKPVTVPRLELTAAVLSVKISRFLQDELKLQNVKEFFWTDSKVVLGYISNEARRFHVYVANRVQEIRDHTEPGQWSHVTTEENPADIASRGVRAEELVDNDLWWHGPAFLSSATLPRMETQHEVEDDDPEVKKLNPVCSFATTAEEKLADITERLEYFSDWRRAKRAVAICVLYMKKLRHRVTMKKGTVQSQDVPKLQVEVEDLNEAEKLILRALQRKELPVGADRATRTEEEKGKEPRLPSVTVPKELSRLDPVLRDGLICVGGRLRKSGLPKEEMHPVILPNRSHVTSLIIKECHEKVGHAGRGLTLARLRSCGYWIVGGRRAVARLILQCVNCKKLRGQVLKQKMADLPADRLEPAAPFTYSGVDLFGPFYVQERRSQVKRWGVLFTCMSSRAVHIETANSLSTDAFLNAYRRFVSRRGPVRVLRSDRGTNFVGGKRAMEEALDEMDNDKIHRELLKENCDWVSFQMNFPSASHMGGVWERMIRSARTVLNGLVQECREARLDDELLRTLLCEVEAIVNSRPLTSFNMSPDEPHPLSPMNLLTQKCSVVLSPPGAFQRGDIYCRRRWRRVQYLADRFWRRWRRDFLPSLQERRKWTAEHANMEQNDVVLIVEDDAPRCKWPLGRITQLHPSDDGLVRKVSVRSGGGTYDRPILKLIKLLP